VPSPDDPPCSVPRESTHLSASYINANVGSTRIIPQPVGIVLDPMHVNITCLYPTDAATDIRDNDGCGPPTQDPKYGSKGARRAGIVGRRMARQQIEKYTRENFGDKGWRDIPCTEFFNLPASIANGTAWREREKDPARRNKSDGHVWDQENAYLRLGSHDMADQSMLTDDVCSRLKGGDDSIEFEYKSVEEWFSWELGAFLGHPPCRVEQDTPSFEKHNWWEYSGKCSWQPLEFQQMMDTMKNQFSESSSSISSSRQYTDDSNVNVSLWNEVVAAKPRTVEEERDGIQAVFYVRYPNESEEGLAAARKLAVAEAKRLGDKPVLMMEWQQQRNQQEEDQEEEAKYGPLFTCPADESDEADDDGDISGRTSRGQARIEQGRWI